MAKDPTDGPDTSDLEERAARDDDDHGGAVAHDDDHDLLAKLDKFDEEEDEKTRAKKKAETARKAEKKKAEGAAGKTKAPPAKKKDEDDADDEGDDEEKPKKPAAEDDDQAEDDEEEADAGEEAADDKDPKQPAKKDEVPSKALNAILREKKRAMDDVTRARGELVQREHGVQQKERELAAKWGPVEKEQQALSALGQRVKSSPRSAIQLLKKLGTTHWEDIANYAISQSDNPKITPEFKRQYSLDDGGASSELDELRRKQAELEQWKKTQEDEKAATEARTRQESAELAFVDQVIEQAGEDHAFVAAALKNNPKLLKSHLRALTQELYERDRKVPPIEKVLTEFERRRREEAAAYGHGLPTKKKPTAGENDAANDLAQTSRARAALDDDADDDDDEEARQARIRQRLDEMDEEDRLKKKQRRK